MSALLNAAVAVASAPLANANASLYIN